MIQKSLLGQIYADKAKIKGVDSMSSPNASVGDPGTIEGIYQKYLQAFKKGVYSYIKEERDPLTRQTVPRKYFAGGAENNFAQVAEFRKVGPVIMDNAVDQGLASNGRVATVDFNAVNEQLSPAMIVPEGQDTLTLRPGEKLSKDFVGELWIDTGVDVYKMWIGEDDSDRLRAVSFLGVWHQRFDRVNGGPVETAVYNDVPSDRKGVFLWIEEKFNFNIVIKFSTETSKDTWSLNNTSNHDITVTGQFEDKTRMIDKEKERAAILLAKYLVEKGTTFSAVLEQYGDKINEIDEIIYGLERTPLPAHLQLIFEKYRSEDFFALIKRQLRVVYDEPPGTVIVKRLTGQPAKLKLELADAAMTNKIKPYAAPVLDEVDAVRGLISMHGSIVFMQLEQQDETLTALRNLDHLTLLYKKNVVLSTLITL